MVKTGKAVDVTTHRGTRRLSAGLVLALTAAVIGVAIPTAAYAAITTVSVTSSLDMQPGDSKQLTIKVTADVADPTVAITVSLAGLGSDVSFNGSGSVNCSGNNCSGNLPATTPDDGKFTGTVTLIVAAKSSVSVGAGSTATGTGAVTAGGKSDNFQVTLHGPAAQSQPSNVVPQVTGVVKDIATGKGIPGVKLQLQDADNHDFDATSNAAGAYTFKSSGNKNISPGTAAITATKDGYTYDARPFNLTAGQPATFEVTMTSVITAGPSDTAPAAAAPTATDSAASTVPLADAPSGKSNHYLTFMIIAGAVLILAGIGAIATLLLRRRNEDDDEDEDDEPAPVRRGPPPGARPAARRPEQATMVAARSPGFDDRTAVVRPVVDDEYPDPYGAPPPRSPQQYGGGQYGQRPPQGPGQGQYNAGYDQPTAYTPAARPPAPRPVRRWWPGRPLRRAHQLRRRVPGGALPGARRPVPGAAGTDPVPAGPVPGRGLPGRPVRLRRPGLRSPVPGRRAPTRRRVRRWR